MDITCPRDSLFGYNAFVLKFPDLRRKPSFLFDFQRFFSPKRCSAKTD